MPTAGERVKHQTPDVVYNARSSPHPSALFRPCLRPSERAPARSVPSKPGGGFDGTEWARTGPEQGPNNADGCGEDRA